MRECREPGWRKTGGEIASSPLGWGVGRNVRSSAMLAAMNPPGTVCSAGGARIRERWGEAPAFGKNLRKCQNTP